MLQVLPQRVCVVRTGQASWTLKLTNPSEPLCYSLSMLQHWLQQCTISCCHSLAAATIKADHLKQAASTSLWCADAVSQGTGHPNVVRLRAPLPPHPSAPSLIPTAPEARECTTVPPAQLAGAGLAGEEPQHQAL